MKKRRRPVALPSLQPQTEKAIEDLIGEYSIRGSNAPDTEAYEIHGRHYVTFGVDHDRLYQAENVCHALVWFVYGLHQHTKNLANGIYDFDNLDARPELVSRGEFDKWAEEAKQDFDAKQKLLEQIKAVAKEANDDAFLKHLEFATTFADDLEADQCRRHAVADVTRFPPLPGKLWTLAEIRGALKFWYQMDVSDNRLIERDCKALKIDFERKRVGRQKAAKPKRCTSRRPNEGPGGEAAKNPD